ncbi:MAG: hypothetical protein BGO87_13245 [Flavobacteriia bacterium 40-80]|nr:MAG: hypothetical protein BGO87_13245 [Flavobacteriia bacterium 40-80]
MNNYFSTFNLSANDTTRLEQIRFILLNLFVFFLPFDKFYTTLILYVLIITTLLNFNKMKLKQIPKNFWIFQIIFFLSVSGYFYSQNKIEAISLIERQLVIFIFPLLIPLAIKITKEKVTILLVTLCISCTLAILGLFTYSLYVILQLQLPLNHLLSEDFFNHNFSNPIGIHAGYLSAYLSLSVTFLITLLSTRKTIRNVIVSLILFILTVGLLFLAARSILIYTTIIAVVFYPMFYVKRKGRYLFFFTIIVGLSLLFITKNQFLNSRFSENLMEDINFKSSYNNLEIIEPRSERWKIGLNLVKNAAFIGYGTGDERDQLKVKYKEKGYIISYIERYNVHNQYLSILIKHGILGLGIFLFAFGYYIRLAVKSRSYIYISFLFGISFFFLTENVLDTNKGIFFFAFFNTIFGYIFYVPRFPTRVKDQRAP